MTQLNISNLVYKRNRVRRLVVEVGTIRRHALDNITFCKLDLLEMDEGHSSVVVAYQVAVSDWVCISLLKPDQAIWQTSNLARCSCYKMSESQIDD